MKKKTVRKREGDVGMEEKYVIWSTENGICNIVINSPKTLNAIGIPILDGLEEALQSCFDEEVRAVIISAAGPAFCAGGDLPAAVKYGAYEWCLQSVKQMGAVVNLIRELPKPVIASVQGACYGVGMSLAMLCDLRIASESMVMKQAYTSVGLAPDGGWTLTVPQAIGVSKAFELLMMDPAVPAAEALRLGLVNKVVPDDALAAETMKLAAKLASGATKSFATGKALINQSMYLGLQNQCEKERWGIANCTKNEDFQEGFDAVFNKRKPNYKGR